MADKGASLDFIRTVGVVSDKKPVVPQKTRKVILVADFDKVEAMFVRGHGVVTYQDFQKNGQYRFSLKDLSVVFALSKEGLQKEMLQTRHHRVADKSLAGHVLDIDFFDPDKKQVRVAQLEPIDDSTYIKANPAIYREAKSLFQLK